MDTPGLNALEKFAAEAADRDWLAFLGAERAAPPPVDDGLGEDDLQFLHGIAKRAFVEEVEAASGGGKVAAWALSMVDDYQMDVEFAKLSMDLAEVPDQVRTFVFKHAGTQPELEDLHGLAKRAFLEELHDAFGGDVDLVKEALALVDDDAFDVAVAGMAMGIEKTAGMWGAAKGVAGTVGGLLRRGVGQAATGIGEKLVSSGKKARKGFASAMMVEKATSGAGADYAARRLSQMKGGAGAGGGRIRLGKRLQNWGNVQHFKGMPGGVPAGTALPKPRFPSVVKGAPVTKGAPAGGTSPKKPVDPDVPPKKTVDPDVPPKVDPDVPPKTGPDGEPIGLWNGFSGWFDRATPLQKAIAVGVPAIGAEAALD